MLSERGPLPTSEAVPFAIDLQADWLVDLARQGLREIEGDAWQEEIVAQIPALLAQYLDWTRTVPRERLAAALNVLAAPTADGPRLARVFAAEGFVDAVRRALAGRAFVPVLANGAADHATGAAARLLPRAFEAPFAVDPDLRGDLVFGAPIVDSEAAQERARQFLAWLGLCPAVAPSEVQWPAALDAWRAVLASDDDRDTALFELWGCLAKNSEWDALPSVRTAAGTWVLPGQIRRLNEAEPDDDQPGGAAVRRALGDRLPRPDEMLSTALRARVDRSSTAGGAWVRRHEGVVSLAEAIREAYEELARAAACDASLFLPLPVWAAARGAQRTDLVPLVLSDGDARARAPTEVLLACAGVPGAEARRQIFRALPVLDDRYLDATQDVGALLAFLTTIGLQGALDLSESVQTVVSSRGDDVATIIDVDRGSVTAANTSGYTVRDSDWIIDLEKVAPAALAEWLEAEHARLIGRGRLRATWKSWSPGNAIGRARATWVERLERYGWVPCADGVHRPPTQVLIELTPDYTDAPVARLSGALVRTLEREGVRWGKNVSKAPALRRLQQTTRPFTASELATVVADAVAWVEAHREDETELLRILPAVELGGRQLARWVRAVGSAGTAHSGLDGWVDALPEALAVALARVPGYAVAATTTPSMALSFLRDVWRCAEAGMDVNIDRRRVIPIAYRYVMAHDAARAEMQALAAERPEKVFVFSRDGWSSLADRPVVDDMADERLVALIATGRRPVRASHLTDDLGGLATITDCLGLERVSSLVQGHLRLGMAALEPAFGSNVVRVLELVARDSNVPRVATVKWVRGIDVRVGATSIDLGARFDEASNTLWLVVDRGRMTEDLVSLLIARYTLSQRGHACGMLSLALANVDQPAGFAQSLRRLARALNIDDSTLPADGGPRQEETEVPVDAPTEGGGTGEGAPQGERTADQGGDPAMHGELDAPDAAGASDLVEFAGKQFLSVEAAVQSFTAEVVALPLSEAKVGEGVEPVADRAARRGTGGEGGRERFSPKSSVTGRLGEIYALRWLRMAPNRPPGVRVIDVSTVAARAAASYPVAYGAPDSSVSPGCDFLAFENGDEALPVGVEIKSRRDNGPIEFVWTRREAEACLRASRGERDPRWPLGEYRVLVVSDLLAPGTMPAVCVLSAEACLKGAEATGWVVRATVP